MAGNERVLRVVIAGEDRGASKTLNDVEKAASRVDPAAKTASNALGGIKSSLVNLVPGGQQAESALSKVSGSGTALGGALSGALVGGAAAGGAALVAMSVQGVGAVVDLAKETAAYQRVAGGTTQQASSMVVAFRELGIDVDTGAKAMARLGREVAAGGSTLSQYGIEVARNKNGTADLNGTLLNIVDAYNATTDAASRDAIAQAAFGRAGIALQPILARGREGLDELTKAAQKHGEILDDQSKNAAIAYARAQRDMGEAVKGFEMQLGEGLIPKLTESTKSLSGFIDMVNTATKPIGGLGGVLGQLVESPLGEAWGEMSDVLHGKAPIWESAADHAKRLKEEQDKAAKATQDASDAAETDAASTQRLAASQKEAEQAAKALKSAQDGLLSDARALQSAQEGQVTASQNVANAERDLAVKQRDLNKLLNESAVDAKAVAAAQRNLEDSTVRVTDADEKLTDAKQKLDDLLNKAAVDAKEEAKAQRDLENATRTAADAQDALTTAKKAFDDLTAGPSARSLGDANLRISESTVGLQRAQTRLTDSQKRLRSIQDSGAATEDDLTAARLDVTDASNAATRASEEQADAQQALIDLENAGKEGSKEYEQARRNVDDAQRQLTDATRAQSDAQQALDTVEAGDPNRSANIATARRDVRDAERSLVDARQAQIDAQTNLRTVEAGDPDRSQKIADARDAVATAERGLRDAHSEVTQKALDFALAQERLNNDIKQGGIASGELKANLQQIAQLYPAAGPLIALLLAQVGVADPNILRDAPNRGVIHRASGGAVGPGTYMFGETGEEVVEFGSGTSGRAYSASRTAAMLGPTVTHNITVNVTAPPGDDPERTGRLIGTEIVRVLNAA